MCNGCPFASLSLSVPPLSKPHLNWMHKHAQQGGCSDSHTHTQSEAHTLASQCADHRRLKNRRRENVIIGGNCALG